jgi:surface protein
MFSNCNNLTSLDVSNFDTSNVTETASMFQNCKSLTTLDISNFDTSNVTYMSYMFQHCNNLQTLDLSNFITSNVNNMYGMFYGCNNLQTLDLSNWDTSSIEYALGTENFLGSCDNLRELRLDNCSNSTIEKIINSVGFPIGAIEGETRTIYCKELEAEGLEAPDGWVFEYVAEDYINSGKPYIVTAFAGGDYSVVGAEHAGGYDMDGNNSWQISYDNETWEDITSNNMTQGQNTVYLRPNYDVIGEDAIPMYRLFEGSNGLRGVEFHNFDFSADRFGEDLTVRPYIAPYIDYMFYGCSSLLSLDLSAWDTSNVCNMSYMFADCYNLRSLDIRNWDTSGLEEFDPEDPEGGVNNILTNCNNLLTLCLDDCSNDTINNIVNSMGFPTGLTSDGKQRDIRCRQANAEGITLPDGWNFSYID